MGIHITKENIKEDSITVKNNTGFTLTKGKIVTPKGESNNMPEVELANACTYTQSRFVGMVQNDIVEGAIGEVVLLGEVTGLDTSTLNQGIAYLSTEGNLTNIRPTYGEFNVICCFVAVADNESGVVFMDRTISELTAEVTDTNGFTVAQRENTTLDFNETTREFTIAPISGTDFYYYEHGIKFINGIETVTLDDVEGLNVLYFNEGVFTYRLLEDTSLIEDIIKVHCIVAYIYWDAVNKKSVYFGDERHGISMSPETHIYLHNNFGCRYRSGLAIGDILSDQTGNLDAHAQFSITGGRIEDEDLPTLIEGVESTIGYPIYYIEGNNLKRCTLNSGFPVLTTGSGRLAYNQITNGIGQLNEVTNGDFVLCHVFATNSYLENEKVVVVLGQNEYSNLRMARDGATTEIHSLLATLITAETVPIATIIFQTKNNYSNSVKARIKTTEEGEDFLDWRKERLGQAFSPANVINIKEFTPSSSNTIGTKGQICWDSNYIYVCISDNFWKRTEIVNW